MPREREAPLLPVRRVDANDQLCRFFCSLSGPQIVEGLRTADFRYAYMDQPLGRVTHGRLLQMMQQTEKLVPNPV